MIKIEKFSIVSDYIIHFFFSDGTEKTIDIHTFLTKEGKLTKPLLKPAYFNKIALYEDGRGVYWPNGYDICPDFLRYHATSMDQKQNVVL